MSYKITEYKLKGDSCVIVYAGIIPKCDKTEISREIKHCNKDILVTVFRHESEV